MAKKKGKKKDFVEVTKEEFVTNLIDFPKLWDSIDRWFNKTNKECKTCGTPLIYPDIYAIMEKIEKELKKQLKGAKK